MICSFHEVLHLWGFSYFLDDAHFLCKVYAKRAICYYVLFFIYIDIFEKWDKSIKLGKITMCSGEINQTHVPNSHF